MLNLDQFQPTMSSIPHSARRNNTNSTIRAPLPAYSSEDPWNTNPRFTSPPSATAGGSGGFGAAIDGLPTGTTSSLAGTGLPNDWWKKQENIRVTILGQQGFILNRYTVYEINSDVSKNLEHCPAGRLLSILAATNPCGSPLFGIYLPVGGSYSPLSIQIISCVTTQTSRRWELYNGLFFSLS